jgi:phage regulator Rha-like protein
MRKLGNIKTVQRNNKELVKLLDLHHPDVTDLEIQDYLCIIENRFIPYAYMEGVGILFPAVCVSEAFGKHRTDYGSNYAYKPKLKDLLRGDHYRMRERVKRQNQYMQAVSEAREDDGSLAIFVSSKQLESYRKDFIERYTSETFSIKTVSWLLDFRRTYDYICRSTASITLSSNRTAAPVFLHDKTLYIDTRLIAEQLNILHDSLLSLLVTYWKEIEGFGSIIKKEYTYVAPGAAYTTHRPYYLLNEDQCYLLGTLCRNTERAVEFKTWLVNQFSKARNITNNQYMLMDNERRIQQELLELCNYTAIKAQAEFPLPIRELDAGGNLVTSVKRIDLFLDRRVAIELKNVKITQEILLEIIDTRGYFHSLRKIETFEYLVVSSPQGLSHNAVKLLEVLYPRVVFMYPYQIGDALAKAALMQYPEKSHWWLWRFIFAKCSKVLSKDFFAKGPNIEFLSEPKENTNYKTPEARRVNKKRNKPNGVENPLNGNTE